MPHEAGEGYTAIKSWIQDNLSAILSGNVPFDFFNPQAQEEANKYLVEQIQERLRILTGDEYTIIRNIPPTPLGRGEISSIAAQQSKSTFAQVYDVLRNVGNRVKGFFRKLFGG